MAANELTAVNAVLSADERRIELLAEEKKLLALMEEGETDMVIQEKLNRVYAEQRAIGTDAAEARARRILAVSNWVSFLCFLLL